MRTVSLSYLLQSAIVAFVSSGFAIYWVYAFRGVSHYQFGTLLLFIAVSWYFIDQIKKMIASVDGENALFIEFLNVKYKGQFETIKGELVDVLKIISEDDRKIMFGGLASAVLTRRLYALSLIIYNISIGASMYIMFFLGVNNEW